MSLKKNSNFGNRTRDLPACKAMPQPSAPPRAPTYGRTETNRLIDYNNSSMDILCISIVFKKNLKKKVDNTVLT